MIHSSIAAAERIMQISDSLYIYNTTLLCGTCSKFFFFSPVRTSAEEVGPTKLNPKPPSPFAMVAVTMGEFSRENCM